MLVYSSANTNFDLHSSGTTRPYAISKYPSLLIIDDPSDLVVAGLNEITSSQFPSFKN